MTVVLKFSTTTRGERSVTMDSPTLQQALPATLSDSGIVRLLFLKSHVQFLYFCVAPKLPAELVQSLRKTRIISVKNFRLRQHSVVNYK